MYAPYATSLVSCMFLIAIAYPSFSMSLINPLMSFRLPWLTGVREKRVLLELTCK